MRGTAASMTVLRPKSAREALKLYARTPDALPIVGGTDLMVLWNLGDLNDRVMLDLSRISEWSRIERVKSESGATLRIGALATHTTVLHHAMVRRHFSLLADACATIGGIQIQNRGTIGGNIANASPAGDTFPPLAVYDARIHIVSAPTAGASGRRVVPFLDIFAGVKKTTLGAGELIEAIDLPIPSRAPARQFFRKVGTRAAQAISKTVAAGALWLNDDGTVADVRLALGSMAPTVRRLRTIESALIGQRLTPDRVRDAVARISEDVSPIDDVRSTATYRLTTSQRVLEAFLLGLPL
jgi:xanthine dehydrogenase small subunit